MKPSLTLLVLLCISISLFSQNDKDIPEFGKVTKADLELKECDFDKNAEAMYLLNWAEAYGSINYQTEINPITYLTDYRVRIKILKDKGLDDANVKIHYIGGHNGEVVKGIVAQTYNLDPSGNIVVTKLDKGQIFNKQINKVLSEVAFTLPQVKVGSIIEYKYTVEGRDLASTALSYWYFQRELPVRISRYTTNYPQELVLSSVPDVTLPLDIKNDSKGTNTIRIYTMQNVPGLRDEPYISCDDDYLQRLQTRMVALDFPGVPRRNLIRTWPQVIKDLMDDDDFGVQLKKSIPRTDDLEALLKKEPTAYGKMVTIHQYVRKNMVWDGQDNFWTNYGVKSAWKEKKGTSGEINLILINLLKDAGLNAHAVLVSTRNNGRVNTGFPGYSQFNKVMAYVKIGDKFFVLDGTEKFTPTRLIPYDVLASEGLVIEKPDTYEWGWTTLWDESQQRKNTIILAGNIDENGVMKGEATVTSMDYARVHRMPKLKEGKDKFKEFYFTKDNPGSTIDSFFLENENEDSLPLIQHLKFTEPLNASGEYKYFTVNLFSGLEVNPFVADERTSDVFFGYNQKITIVGTFNIPDSYQFEELPKNMRMMMPDTGIVFSRFFQVQDQTLSVRINLDFKKPIYSAEEYPEFHEFYKKLFAILNEQIVIKKKSKP